MAKSQQRRLEELEKRKAAANHANITRSEAWAKVRHVYRSKWIREQYGIDDPISEAEEEYWQSNRHQPRDEAAFLRVLYAKIQREPERFRRIYGDLFTPVQAAAPGVSQAPGAGE